MVDQIKKLELHDSSLKQLIFDFENEYIELKISMLNTETNAVEDLILKFSEISIIKFGDIDILQHSEIFRLKIHETEEGFRANFIILEGFGAKDFDFCFEFKEAFIIKNEK